MPCRVVPFSIAYIIHVYSSLQSVGSLGRGTHGRGRRDIALSRPEGALGFDEQGVGPLGPAAVDDVSGHLWTAGPLFNCDRCFVRLIFRTHSLVVLDLSYNKIVSIPAEIGKLQMLRFATNPLSMHRLIPVGRCLYVLNRELRASFNMLAAIPPEIGKLKRLKKLYLNTNKLTSIPKEVLCYVLTYVHAFVFLMRGSMYIRWLSWRCLRSWCCPRTASRSCRPT